jgi:hypothetical protein
VDGYEMCAWGDSAQYSAADPRLSGTATRWANEYEEEGYELYAVELVNDEGTWVGTGWASYRSPVAVSTLIGERAYEGLTAYLISDYENYEDHLGEFIIRAVIVEGELPPFPELPAE